MKTQSIKTTFSLARYHLPSLPILHVFELNRIEFEYIEWNLDSIQLNFNPNKFNSNLGELNSTIGLRFNWREWDQIGGEGSENLLVNMVLEVFKKKHKSKKT
jgi:hypothetical protein